MDAAEPDGMDSFAGQPFDLRHFVTVLTDVARGIQDGTIKVPK